MKNVSILFAFALLFVFNFTFAQNDPLDDIVKLEKKAALFKMADLATSEEKGIDLFYQRFNWTADPAEFYISGEVVMYFTVTEDQLSEIDLEMFNAGLDVSSVQSSQGNLNFEEIGEWQFKITLPNALPLGAVDSLIITYEGTPNNTGFGSFVSSSHGPDETPLMWTLSEPYGARDWRPVKQDLNDKIDSTDIYVTSPLGYSVAANGVLM
ncbi:MAG: hypothetical protein KDC24_15200, partial [Saprospiraceae bacterium]|nr:hypothetical protein [Saprospiraceae bacterium]